MSTIVPRHFKIHLQLLLVLLFTPHVITLFSDFLKNLYLHILKMWNKTILHCFCRWTGPPIHVMSYKLIIVFNKITARSTLFLIKTKKKPNRT